MENLRLIMDLDGCSYHSRRRSDSADRLSHQVAIHSDLEFVLKEMRRLRFNCFFAIEISQDVNERRVEWMGGSMKNSLESVFFEEQGKWRSH
jgi:hypothetical protein